MSNKLGWLAVIGPFYALTSIWIAISLSPWFGWRTNAISDLGVHSVAPLFNISLITCGIMCAIFAVGVFLRFRNWLGKVGMAIMFLACISLVGIGVFTEDYSPTHYQFSVAFFVLLIIAALVLGPFFLLKRKTRILGIGALLVTAIGIYGWAYEFSVGWGSGIAIPEALTFVPGGIWFAMLGVWVLKKDVCRKKVQNPALQMNII
ncbi:MAG: DUF998 domain-containing protein [Thermoplasmata archaeon]|nr:DUF998 domain-containing protein [Thermoplasmata archaeon]